MFGISALLFAVLTGATSTIFIEPAIPDLEIPSGADLSLNCTSDSPAAWYYPPSAEGSDSSTKSVTYSRTNDDKYLTVIFIHHAHYLDTGFYYCSSNLTDSEESKIYIFVRDPENLLAVNESYAFISGHEFSEVIIPCKPTTQDVKVKLLKDLKEVDISFDIHKGFILKNLMMTDSRHLYTCRASRRNETSEVNYELHVLPKSEGINKPIIDLVGSEGPHIVVGQDIDLSCSLIVPSGVNVQIQWKIPDNVEKNRTSYNASTIKDVLGTMNRRRAYNILTIKNVDIDDSGIYSCHVADHSNNSNFNSFEMKIYHPDETYLFLKIEGEDVIEVRAGEKEAHWIVHINAFPSANLHWFGPGNNTISNSDKYEVYTDSTQTKVTVKNISIFDSGTYTLQAESSIGKEKVNVTLLVQDLPKVYLNKEKVYFDINKEESINCTIVAFPKPTVSWTFHQCTDYETFCSEGHKHPAAPKDSEPLISINHVKWVSTVKWYASESGIITCLAKNDLGQKEDSMQFRVSDVNNGFDIWGPRHRVFSSDSILLGCGASNYEFHGEIDWIYKSEKDHEGGQVLVNAPSVGISITTNDTLFSHQTFLHLSDVNSGKSGNYICRVKTLRPSVYREKEFKLLVLDREAPAFTFFSSKNGSKITIDAGKFISWNCSVSGIPEPEVIWYKDNQILETKNDRVKLENRNRTLRITYASLEDTGIYRCIASNSAGNVSAEYTLKIRGLVVQSKILLWILIVLTIGILISVTVLAIYCMKYKKEQKKRRELISVGLYNFSEGQVEAIDPNIDIGEQADLLPYDKKWEFPRDKLKLGKQLGSGAFGIVVKGQAYGLHEDNELVTVAVKMVKKTSDISHVKSLATELKIMAHLGQHLNVVNLLGACTGNVHNRELLVLVEYCRYGNLHKYLQNHRTTFINQINEVTGYVDFSKSRSAFTELTYLKPNAYYQPNSEQASEYSNGHSAVTYTTSLSTPIGEDGYLLNRDAEILAEYHGDYRINSVRPICTQDLFCWGYQVAKGMGYLASRKVLHGDLAARNVLLAEGNIVKICDFGLAKSMYSRENYKNKKRDIPLPVKWMAIEAITDGIFSTQSDIWSFGVFIWELFSLAVTPYPGLYGEVFYQKLLQGYRMEKPKYATEDVYNLMLECWKEKPMLRPSFEECAERLGQMLGQNVKQHYLDLNNPYLNLNAQLSAESDHLSKMVQPTYENCLAAGLPDNTPEGYVIMKKANEVDESQNEMELKPMLLPGCNSFLNPGYEDMKTFGALYYSNLSQDCPISEVIVDSD
nr:vascular endothelial growth factor receptor 1 isoform X2 [Halyomorpha halys]